MAEQTEEDRLSGFLRLRFGSVEVEIPTLPLRPSRLWVELLNERLNVLGKSVGTTGQQADLLALATSAGDVAVDLVVAYDQSAAIAGGRDWLEENATPRQIKDALEVMREEAIPFGGAAELMQLMAMAAARAAEQLAEQNSTNGPFPTGPSPAATGSPSLALLNRATRRASSRSSGKKASGA